jgi:hypothetical protein
MKNKLINIFYWVITTLFFVIYWTQVGSWYNSGDVEMYGIIGAGIAANGAFIGNIIWTIITKNEEYKYKHGGKDMPFVANIKKIFGR